MKQENDRFNFLSQQGMHNILFSSDEKCEICMNFIEFRKVVVLELCEC